MIKHLFSLLATLLFAGILAAQEPDYTLAQKLQQLIRESGLDAGVYVRHLKKGTVAEVNADTLYPTASTIKVPIMCGVFSKIEKGELSYDSVLVYRDSLMYSRSDIVGMLKDSSRIELSRVIMLMESTSDNTASLWCQAMAGGGQEINRWLADNGFNNIRVNSRTPGREAFREAYGWGYTSPRDMAELLALIYAGKAVSPAASERMYRVLCNIFWDDRGLSQIPPYVQAASKQGFVRSSTSEVMLVNAPHGDYVYCIATKNQKSKSAYENEGTELLRKVSKLLWDYYEPEHGWSANKEVLEKYSK